MGWIKNGANQLNSYISFNLYHGKSDRMDITFFQCLVETKSDLKLNMSFLFFDLIYDIIIWLWGGF